jgi:hypothetical protein
MVLDFVESRVANPVKMVDWGAVDEAQGVVCSCCGWSGRLGECQQAAAEDTRAYSCRQCSMVLLARVFPQIIPLRFVAGSMEWRVKDRLAANF